MERHSAVCKQHDCKVCKVQSSICIAAQLPVSTVEQKAAQQAAAQAAAQALVQAQKAAQEAAKKVAQEAQELAQKAAQEQQDALQLAASPTEICYYDKDNKLIRIEYVEEHPMHGEVRHFDADGKLSRIDFPDGRSFVPEDKKRKYVEVLVVDE